MITKTIWIGRRAVYSGVYAYNYPGDVTDYGWFTFYVEVRHG